MKITIHAKDMKVSPELEAKIIKKFAKFQRYFGDDAKAEVKFVPVKDILHTELTFVISGNYYRTEALNNDALASVEETIDKMEGQIRKHKSRMKKQKKELSYLKEYFRDNDSELADESEENEAKITKKKSFKISVMTPNEAVIQLEMLNHSFLLFINDETGKVALIYKRKDGNYGMIEPEY